LSRKVTQKKILASGRYEILRLLAEGGMGKVFLATDHNLDTKVVIKIPHAAMLADAEFVARFQREIRSLVKLRHRSIVSILDVGEQDGVPFAVMQYMEGKSLEDRLADGPQSEEAIQAWLPDVAVALDFVHREGYVHRDIKPANILFDREGNAYVGDFGVIKVVGEHEARQTSKKSLTGAGMVLGTPEYMAPELVMGEPFDHRVDQYALAVTVFECLAGKRPFEGEPGAVMVKQSTAAVPSLAAMCPTVSAQAVAAVNRGLAKKADVRFKSCSQFASTLSGRGQAATWPNATSAAATAASPAGEVVDQTHKLSCPGCGVKLRLGSRHAGKTIKCPGCKLALKVAEDLSALAIPQADGNASVVGASDTAANAVAITASRQNLESSSTRNRLMFVIPAVLGSIVVILAFVLLRKKIPNKLRFRRCLLTPQTNKKSRRRRNLISQPPNRLSRPNQS
jgi:tRNA A-37 threonylcarbamoyl transferase component Bud32